MNPSQLKYYPHNMRLETDIEPARKAHGPCLLSLGVEPVEKVKKIAAGKVFCVKMAALYDKAGRRWHDIKSIHTNRPN
jgi:hypothetical protein